jgi:hypothetical protein
LIIINGETNNHTIQEKETAKNKAIFAMDNSAVIIKMLNIRNEKSTDIAEK